jgi:excisionase family DNA binding protein
VIAPIAVGPSELPEILTVEEAAALLRIEVKTLYDAIREGRVPHQRVSPRRIRLSRSALLEWVAGKRAA